MKNQNKDILTNKNYGKDCFSDGEEFNENYDLFSSSNYEDSVLIGLTNFVQDRERDINSKDFLLSEMEKENDRLKRDSYRLKRDSLKLKEEYEKTLEQFELIRNKNDSADSIIKNFELKFDRYFKDYANLERKRYDLQKKSNKYFYENLLLRGYLTKLKEENEDLRKREIEILTASIESFRNERFLSFKNWDFLFFYLTLFIPLLTIFAYSCFSNFFKKKDNHYIS